jgi:hypothetical protein
MKSCFLRPAVKAAALALVACSVQAQVDDPAAWKEADVAMPSAWSAERAVEFTLEGQTSMRYAIDPKTLRLDSDGVVRYVFIARSSSGALNALFEGIRCQTSEVKVYARWDPDARQWRSGSNEPWQALGFRGATRRATQMARGGVCEGNAPNRTAAEILDRLRNGRTDYLR